MFLATDINQGGDDYIAGKNVVLVPITFSQTWLRFLSY